MIYFVSLNSARKSMNVQQLRADYIARAFFKSHRLDPVGLSRYFSQLPELFIFLAAAVFLVLLIRRLFLIRKNLREESILLELTPPAFTEKTAYTTQQLFSIIHNLAERKSMLDKLFGRKVLFSFENAST